MLPLEHTRLKLTVLNAALEDEFWGYAAIDLHDRLLPLEVDGMGLKPLLNEEGDLLKPVCTANKTPTTCTSTCSRPYEYMYEYMQ